MLTFCLYFTFLFGISTPVVCHERRERFRIWSLGRCRQIEIARHEGQEEIAHSQESVQHFFRYQAWREKI